jgi:hypothetical protein
MDNVVVLKTKGPAPLLDNARMYRDKAFAIEEAMERPVKWASLEVPGGR